MDDRTIKLEGDTWRVLAQGARRSHETYCHLASTTRYVEQKNGKRPIQISTWVPDTLLNEAAS